MLPRRRIIPTVVIGLYAAVLSYVGSVVLVVESIDLWNNKFEAAMGGWNRLGPLFRQFALATVIASAAAIAWIATIRCWRGRWTKTSDYIAYAVILGGAGLFLLLSLM